MTSQSAEHLFQNSGNNYSETIAGLEDIVVPGRGGKKNKKHNKKHSRNEGDDDDLPSPSEISRYIRIAPSLL